MGARFLVMGVSIIARTPTCQRFPYRWVSWLFALKPPPLLLPVGVLVILRSFSSDPNINLLGITKNGDRHLRALLIHGARSVVQRCPKRQDGLGRWVNELRNRRGHNKAVVALANKCARIAWAVLSSKEGFAIEKAFAAA